MAETNTRPYSVTKATAAIVATTKLLTGGTGACDLASAGLSRRGSTAFVAAAARRSRFLPSGG